MKKVVIRSMDEYYQKYLPLYSKKHPITIRVSEEEYKLVMRLRGIKYA